MAILAVEIPVSKWSGLTFFKNQNLTNFSNISKYYGSKNLNFQNLTVLELDFSKFNVFSNVKLEHHLDHFTLLWDWYFTSVLLRSKLSYNSPISFISFSKSEENFGGFQFRLGSNLFAEIMYGRFLCLLK